MSKLFGGGSQDAAKEAQKRAEEEARKSRQLQEIANNRQLAAAQAKEGEGQVTRRRARGRALFQDAEGGGNGSTLA